MIQLQNLIAVHEKHLSFFKTIQVENLVMVKTIV